MSTLGSKPADGGTRAADLEPALDFNHQLPGTQFGKSEGQEAFWLSAHQSTVDNPGPIT